MWVLIEGTSFSGLLWANTLKSESLLCARSPTGLSSFWMCLRDSSGCVRGTACSAHRGTPAGSFPCLGAGSCAPVADPGQPQLVPEMGGPGTAPSFAPPGGHEGGRCLQRGAGAGRAPSSTSAAKALAALALTVPLSICAETNHGGEVSHAMLWPGTKTFPLPPFSASS